MLSGSASRSSVILAVLVLVALALGGAASRSAGPPAAAAAPHVPARPLDHPCGLTAERQASPLVLEENGEIEVTASYNYRCPEGSRRVHFFLLVENSRDMQRDGRTGRQLLENVREGLAAFVGQIDYDAGSKGGLIVFNRTWSERLPLRGEGGGRQALLAAINTFPVGIGVSAASVGGAINEAMRQFGEAEDAEGATNLILIVQAGASLAGPDDDIGAACRAAKDAGAIVALLILDGVTEPLGDCASPNWTRGSTRPNGEGIPDTLTDLGEAATFGHQAARVEYCDEFSQSFRFVDGSGVPRPPDAIALDQYCWVDDAPAPDEGYEVAYRIRAAADVANEIVQTSSSALVRLTFADASMAEIRFELPEVCVHAAGRPEFCDPFLATLTPQATTPVPTVAPTGTPSPTPPVGSPTSTAETPEITVTPAPTDVVEGARIYLPATARRSAPGSGQGP